MNRASRDISVIPFHYRANDVCYSGVLYLGSIELENVDPSYDTTRGTFKQDPVLGF